MNVRARMILFFNTLHFGGHIISKFYAGFITRQMTLLIFMKLHGNVQVSAALTEPRLLTMCYLIERNTRGMTYDYNKAAAALFLAEQYANAFILPPEVSLKSVYRDIGHACGGMSHLINSALELRDSGINCDVYIGPGCGTALEIFNNLISVWDIPIIGCPASGLGLSAPKSEYTVITRTSYTYVSISSVLLRFLDRYSYTTPAIFQDQSVNVFQQLSVLMQTTVTQHSDYLRYGTQFISFESATDTKQSMKQRMMKASLASRVFVFVASASMVRDFMIMAYELDMTNGDYMFVTIEIYLSDVWGNYTWQFHDEKDSIALKAYESLAILSLKPDTTDTTAEFWRQVIKVSKDRFHFEFSATEQKVLDPVVAHFYDAVFLYAAVVGKMINEDENYRSGLAFTERVANRTFRSPITGTMAFNADSDRVLDYQMRFLNRKNGKHEALMEFLATSSSVKSLGNLTWFGRSALPPNEPRCGFRGDDPICITIYLMPSGTKAGIGIGVVILLIAVWSSVQYATKKLLYSSLDPFWWRILEQDVLVCVGTRHNKFSASNPSMQNGGTGLSARAGKDDNHDTTSEIGTMMTSPGRMGIYNNMTVNLLPLPEPLQRVPANIAREAYLIRSMEHNNLQKFIGVSVNDANLCESIVAEVCEKGTLQDLIDDNRMNLDWEFKNALIRDLTNGMVYIHSSAIQSHGFLNDSNCLIDSRFVLKIGNYGLDCLKPRADLEAYHISQAEFRDVRILLWRAPELLRRAMPPAGTQKGDVYSYAILLQQIVLRSEPFHKSNPHTGGKEYTVLNPADIVDEVCRGLTPPLRPPVPVSACPPQMHTVMEMCWQEEASSRPAFVRVKNIIQNTLKNSGGNIVDYLIRRMETYASDLERQVLTKTNEFMEERQRSTAILQEILPRDIADALSKGHQVKPETFSSTTVFFSSVVGFKEAVTRAKTPRETVHLLNRLYTVCDGIIDPLDVFRVDVLLDEYMLVSGLPVKNGLHHVENIANLALQLRKEIAALTNGTNESFKLRVGIHSGPCVAGVVGLKMPRYCIFGDTVNTASRMESHGEAGKIHVSPTSKALLDLHDEFVLVERGITNIKGKGDMMTYWLVGRT